MFCWRPMREEFHQWLESNEKEFAKKENRSPRLSTEDWLQKHIFTDLYDWLSKLTNKNIFKKKRNIVWTPELIQTVKSIDNPTSHTVDFCLTSLLEGFVTEFAVDQRKSFSEAERYLFKGYHSKYLSSLNLYIKMLLHEK